MSSSLARIQPEVRHADSQGYLEALAGIRRKTLVEGGRTQLVEFRLAKGAVIPLHRHPQEQTGYLVSGRMIMAIEGCDHTLNPGDAWTIPGDVEHGARVLRDSVAVEVFSPLRRDYRR